jgi:hypothetical protein
LPHPASHNNLAPQDGSFFWVEAFTAEETISFCGSSSSVLHGDLLPRFEICVIFVRIFVVQAEAGPAETINLHNIGLAPVRAACMDTVEAGRTSTRRRWSIETGRAGIVGLRVGAQIFVPQVRSCSV